VSKNRLLAAVAFAIVSGCAEKADPRIAMTGGDSQRGLESIRRYGCASCHEIPGVTQARGQVGPPLAAIARRAYLGGVLPNTPDNMVLWIRHPQKVEPRTAMPALGVSESEARDMSAYLYTLR
jgi:cytochrome c